MRGIWILFFVLFTGALELSAQLTGYAGAGGPNAGSPRGNADTTDTTEIPQGIIHVKKATIAPYVKVEYKYYLAHVNTVKMEVPVENGVQGNVEMKDVPVFDSTVYSRLIKRQYPRKIKDPLLSKMFVENMKFLYGSGDTMRADTMVLGLWIDNRGRVREVIDDPEYTLNMPEQMVNELTRTSQLLQGAQWGEKGGYYQGRKKMFKQPTLVLESYYCEVFVIVSSYPLTQEQKIAHYAAFDYPLNSPPTDEQQKASKEKNAVEPKR